jgi:hypothetical protein
VHISPLPAQPLSLATNTTAAAIAATATATAAVDAAATGVRPRAHIVELIHARVAPLVTAAAIVAK